jgi:hypothetical protein
MIAPQEHLKNRYSSTPFLANITLFINPSFRGPVGKGIYQMYHQKSAPTGTQIPQIPGIQTFRHPNIRISPDC